jgi:hypothetical protein
MVGQHFDEIDAEFALTEGGGARLENGRVTRVSIQTTEKVPRRFRLVATGTSGTAPCRGSTIRSTHLSAAVAKVGTYVMPMRLNETTRAYFDEACGISPPEDAARYRALLGPIRRKASKPISPKRSPSITRRCGPRLCRQS